MTNAARRTTNGMHASRREFISTAGKALAFSTALRALPASAERAPTQDEFDRDIVRSVRHLGDQFLKNDVGVTGADGATSTVLPNGDSLWVFGDTVEGPFKSIRGLDLTALRSNTGAIVPKQDTSAGISRFRFLASDDAKRPRQLVPFATDENPSVNRLWAIHGTSVDDSVYLFYHRISLLKGVDVFTNFKLDGMGISIAEASDLRFKRLTAPDGTREFWKGDQPTFGVFIIRETDFVYLFGSLATGMYLARTRPEAIEDLSGYEYLVEAPTAAHPGRAPRWNRQFQATATLFDSVPNEMSASFNPHLRMYLAFHTFHRENKIVVRTADRITGPWSAPRLVYRPHVGKDDLVYAAKEHPELARDGGRILYVTFIDSAKYVPQLLEVTLV